MRVPVATSSVHYLRLIERRLQVGTWTLDLRSAQLTCSDGMLRLLGLPQDSHPTVDAVIDRVHRDDRWIVDDLMRASSSPTEERRFRVSPGDGRVRWYGCWVDSFADDPRETWVRRGFMRDVTRSQLATDRLTRHHLVFDKLVEVSGGVALRLDAHGVPHWAEAWTRFTGQSPEELRRSSWIATLHPDDREGVLHLWRQATATPAGFDGVFRVRGPEGIHAPVRLDVQPVVNAEGVLLEWLIFLSPCPPDAPATVEIASPTPAQLRGCRGLLDWTVSRLAAESGVSSATIARYEAGADKDGAIRASTLAKLRAAVEEAGVEFVSGPSGSGIRLRE